MSTVVFYRWSLLLPLVAPLLCLPLQGIPLFDKLGEYLFPSLIFGIVPYFVTLALLFGIFASGNARKISRTIWLMPLAMTVVIAALCYTLALVGWFPT